MDRLPDKNRESANNIVYYSDVITFFMVHPELYDKSTENYSYTADKLQTLQSLVNDLKAKGIYKSVGEILKTWQQLVRDYKKCLNQDKFMPSGSAASTIDFPFYHAMSFLEPALQHRAFVSSISSVQEKEYKNHDLFFKRKRINTFKTSIDNCTNELSSSKTLKVPEPDLFAKKKIAKMTDDTTMNIIEKKIIETLDKVNKKLDDTFENNSSNSQLSFVDLTTSTNCTHHLTTGFNKSFSEIENKKFTETSGTINNRFNDNSDIRLNSQETSDKNCQVSVADPTASVNFVHHLTAALNKIPAGYEDECMMYVLEKLSSFQESLNK